ncbi:TetR family transcriptional regulator C-terminal domain-containing protein, partial [Escherichia coli]|nr:TetR family transcriptional regulator C-terminal domain-containing protein [Escherichia coli]
GLLVSGLGEEEEAARLHALLDGLAVHGLLGRLDNGEMLAVLDAHLREIIREERMDGPGEGRSPGG